MPRRREVRHRLDKAEVRVEGVLRELLAVAGRGDRAHLHGRVLRQKAQQRVADKRHRVPEIRAVIGEHKIPVIIYNCDLNRR